MLNLLYLIPAFPLAGFLVLAGAGRRLPKPVAASIGAGSVGLSALMTVLIGTRFLASPPPGDVHVQTLWSWMTVGDFAPAVSFSLDALSLLMVFVVTFVGFLIHVYSIGFMREDEGFSRFFAFLNLFVASMLVLVLADDLLLLYLGWEGVGLCSYLLIGFWYRDPANGRAARKAFIVTRIGDTAMAVGLFLLFTHLHTLNISEIARLAPQLWPAGSTVAAAAACLLLGGALGKSAQLPLQVWLPDAMAGPTPVSALIHAATMVTAGVYLIARMHAVFLLAPAVLTAIALIGAATLIVAGCSALAQKDIKRVLAYSTISQIGYMFLALGVGAWTAALFHFLTHAFFKALLFLGAGVVISAQHHEHDLSRMGGLRKELPTAFWTFLIGAASLSALPFVTAGFFSKDLILLHVWTASGASRGLFIAGLLGALITATYAFRMVFLAFFGEQRIPVSSRPGRVMLLPLVILAIGSVLCGFLELPHTLGNVRLFSRFLGTALPASPAVQVSVAGELVLQLLGAAACSGGILIAYLFALRRRDLADRLFSTGPPGAIRRFWLEGWGFDVLYDRLLVRPFLRVSQLSRNDFMDQGYTAIAGLHRILSAALVRTQTGGIRWYAAGIAAGAAVILGIIMILAWPSP